MLGRWHAWNLLNLYLLLAFFGTRLSKNICCIHLYLGSPNHPAVLNGRGLVLEGSNPKIKDKRLPGTYIYTLIFVNHIYYIGVYPYSTTSQRISSWLLALRVPQERNVLFPPISPVWKRLENRRAPTGLASGELIRETGFQESYLFLGDWCDVIWQMFDYTIQQWNGKIWRGFFLFHGFDLDMLIYPDGTWEIQEFGW